MTSPSSNSNRHLTIPSSLKSPNNTAQRHLYLNKPAASNNGSSVTVNEMPPPPTPTGLRAQINHLLPRHAYFRARIQVHQVSSVPFVRGEFGVRWKFKSVHALPGSRQGLLGMVKTRSNSKHEKGKGREEDGDSLGSGELADDGMSSIMRPTTSMTNGSRKTSDSSGASIRPSVTTSASSHGHHLSIDSMYSSSHASSSHVNLSSPITTSNPSLPVLLNYTPTPARGTTPFVKLKDHSAVWSYTLDTILKFDVDRDTHSLHEHELKLVVMQRINPDDPPQNPRLGVVYLNLAEYVDKGQVERRYLLQESKTNATLKLTVELEHVSGEPNYVAPPLPKGEILTGIANFLNSDMYRKRPRALDLYGPYRDQQELEIDLLGGTKSSLERKREERKKREDEDTDDETDNVAFDVQRLPVAYGPKTTEALIDALFNPVRTTEKRKESPFTYYMPPSKTRAKSADALGAGKRGITVDTNGQMDGNATIGRRYVSLQQEKTPTRTNTADTIEKGEEASLYSTESSSASVDTSSTSSNSNSVAHSRGSSSSHGHANEPGGVKGWWKRVASRPATPVNVRA
ncbi:N-terminal C2 in EEIG1 and EHBP1 proteins-domain-containing protein [Crucibulum laeve]|uniref:N-terminal C2 in EEIG1 and EHBP1 proteins-domain-containing protein n=1 Tax=Crucibulum laeve TaxID=68775 RepID=A0A5C3LF94_9AGAR|nr:N-terminal C2 in EEIG1 and EHBP1 proteins-domain-containing protein [Crucibulum laeve]